MTRRRYPGTRAALAALVFGAAAFGADTNSTEVSFDGPGSSPRKPPVELTAKTPEQPPDQVWNWHAQNTEIVQFHPRMHAPYEGPNSLHHYNEVKETVSLDLMFGFRLWRGAELHVDSMVWQGFGLTRTLGIEAFPNGEAFRLGTKLPNVTFSRAFLRQTIGLGGDQETVADDQLHLAGQQDVRRVTLTVGKMSAKDILDGNTYSNDPRTQFMNWSLMANGAWDFAADSLGYITGLAAELNQPRWALRYGFFQVPRVSNGMALDPAYLRAWQMVAELERRFTVNERPGAVRLLAYLTSSHMGSYQGALNSSIRPADIVAVRDYRYKFGFGLNAEQAVAKNVGVFTRLGWSDGHTEGWFFNDVDRTASLGVSLKGAWWSRPDDIFGLAGVVSGASAVHSRFLAAGGTGILGGDGALSYGVEKALETYYDFQFCKGVRGTLDYQFVTNPAFNRDRGPVSILGARLHWEF